MRFEEGASGRRLTLKEEMEMKEFVKNKKGFTLIELIMVIVILGILAAVAVPKFLDLQGSARTARLDNLTGALRSAVNILHANYIISGTTYDVTSVVNSVDAQGLTPVVASGTSITAADDNSVTRTWVYTDLTGVGTPGVVNDPT